MSHEDLLGPDDELYDKDDLTEFGYPEDGLMWLSVCSAAPDEAAAEANVNHGPGAGSGVWRVIGQGFLVPELGPSGRPYGGGDENWLEGSEDAPFARRCWRLVNVAQPELYEEEEARPNPHYDPTARKGR